jgi:predicted transposase YdaD
VLRVSADPPYLLHLEFVSGHDVVRIWQFPPQPLLSGGLGLLPLAPISAVTEAELPGIIKRIEQRLRSRQGRRQASVVWAAAYILLGLRYSPNLASQLFRGVVSMKESSTYQAILEEGRQEGRQEGAVAEAKKVLRLQGDVTFGVPDAQTEAAIEQIVELTRLEALLKRLPSVTNWQDLLGTPLGERRKGRRRRSP